MIIRTLSFYPTPLTERILTAGLKDADVDVRTTCCQAWGTLGGQRAVAPLTQALNDDADFDVRIAAARALGATHNHAALTALADALGDNDPAMQFRAVQSMKEISGKDYGTDYKAWQQYARTGNPGQSDQQPVARAWWRSPL